MALKLLRDIWLKSEMAAKLYVDERVDKDGRFLYLDSMGSVSGLELERDPLVTPRYRIDRREIHNAP